MDIDVNFTFVSNKTGLITQFVPHLPQPHLLCNLP